jgi:hypothetical protein
MTTNELRDAMRSQPLRPFTIRAASGEEIDVPHPEFVAFSRSGRTISVALPTGGFAIIDLLLVESSRFGESGHRRRRRSA